MNTVPPIRVLTCQRVADQSPVLALADIAVGKPTALVLRQVRLIQDNPSHSPRIQGPQIAWLDAEHNRHYASPCRIYKPLRKAITEAIVTTLRQEGVTL